MTPTQIKQKLFEMLKLESAESMLDDMQELLNTSDLPDKIRANLEMSSRSLGEGVMKSKAEVDMLANKLAFALRKVPFKTLECATPPSLSMAKATLDFSVRSARGTVQELQPYWKSPELISFDRNHQVTPKENETGMTRDKFHQRLEGFLMTRSVPTSEKGIQRMLEVILDEQTLEAFSPVVPDKTERLTAERLIRDLYALKSSPDTTPETKELAEKMQDAMASHYNRVMRNSGSSLASRLAKDLPLFQSMGDDAFVEAVMARADEMVGMDRDSAQELTDILRSCVDGVLDHLSEANHGCPDLKNLLKNYPRGIEKHGDKIRLDEVGTAFENAVERTVSVDPTVSEFVLASGAFAIIERDFHPDVESALKREIPQIPHKDLRELTSLSELAQIIVTDSGIDDVWTEPAKELRAVLDKIDCKSDDLGDVVRFSSKDGLRNITGWANNMDKLVKKRSEIQSADYLRKELLVCATKLVRELKPFVDERDFKVTMISGFSKEAARDILRSGMKAVANVRNHDPANEMGI